MYRFYLFRFDFWKLRYEMLDSVYNIEYIIYFDSPVYFEVTEKKDKKLLLKY